MKLGQKLKEARVRASMTQEELAKTLGVSRQTISSWENDRSYPDLGSTIKLSKVYRLSLDELLTDDTSVLKAFEDLAQRRRNFWQMMLESGIILELLSVLIVGLGIADLGRLFAWPGFLLLQVAIVMHLRVFDHSRGQILRGLAGLALVWVRLLLNRLIPDWGHNPLSSILNMVPLWLIWSSGVWKVNWKSTRLWLIIFLLIVIPIVVVSQPLIEKGANNPDSPLGQEYRIEEVLYPEDGTQWEHTLINLQAHSLHIAWDGVHSEYFHTKFTYAPPATEGGVQGTWLAASEDDPTDQYVVTVEADDSVVLSYRKNDQLQWQWKLMPNRILSSAMVMTFGHTTTFSPIWYPEGVEGPDYTYSRNRIDVVGSATMTLNAPLPEGQVLTLIEEYHHNDAIETQTYTIGPEKNGSYKIKLETRYEDQEQWALYRIPFEGGEFRFVLTFE